MSASTLNIALKEWSATIDALASGDQIFLLRKGGIREPNRHFELPHQRFLLYPTHYHEADQLLKPEFQHLLEPEPSNSTDYVSIRAWAEVTDVISIDSAEHLAALSDRHVWTDQFIAKRIAWKPRHAADLIILKTYALATPFKLTVEPYHRGCKSWVDIDPPVDTTGAKPAVLDSEWEQRSQEINRLLSQTTSQPVPTT